MKHRKLKRVNLNFVMFNSFILIPDPNNSKFKDYFPPALFLFFCLFPKRKDRTRAQNNCSNSLIPMTGNYGFTSYILDITKIK